jgi:hypothetical protein
LRKQAKKSSEISNRQKRIAKRLNDEEKKMKIPLRHLVIRNVAVAAKN